MSEINDKYKELCIRYGTAASEAMFDFPCQYFQLSDCIGVIAYRVEHKSAIIFGDPICPPEETAKLAEAFHHFCHSNGLSVIYIIASEKFAHWSKQQSLSKISIEVCEEYIFDPTEDPFQNSHRLQHRVEKAKKHGLVVHEYIPVNHEIESAIKQLGIEWQKARKGMQIFLGHLDFFENYTGKRWFYVQDAEKITAMTMLSKIEVRKGWLLKFLVISPDAFQDTSECLVSSVFETLRNENCKFLSKGMVPVDGLGEVYGLGVFSEWCVKKIYKCISWMFNFKKRKAYWLRYKPIAEPAYILFSSPKIGLNQARALMKVFRTNHPLKNIQN